MPADAAFDEPHLVGELVEGGHFVAVAAGLPGELAAEVVYAIEQAAEEDAEVGRLKEVAFFFKAQGGVEAEGQGGAWLLTECVEGGFDEVGDGRPTDGRFWQTDEEFTGGQQLFLVALQGVEGVDRFEGEAAATGADTDAADFVDGEDEVGQILAAVAKEGQAKGKAVTGPHPFAVGEGRDDGVGADDATGVNFGREQPASGAGGDMGRGGGLAAMGFGAGGEADDVGQGVAQVAAGEMPGQA